MNKWCVIVSIMSNVVMAAACVIFYQEADNALRLAEDTTITNMEVMRFTEKLATRNIELLNELSHRRELEDMVFDNNRI